MAVSLSVGIIYLTQRNPTYTSLGRLLVENPRLEPSRQDLVPAVGLVDASLIESQIEILRSQTIALKVIEVQRPLEDAGQNAGSRMLTWIRSPLPTPDENPEAAGSAWPDWIPNGLKLLGLIEADAGATSASSINSELPAFARRLSVKRIGTSSAIEIKFTAKTPERAAAVVNAVIEAYLAEQTAAAAVAAVTASAWLRDRAKDLGPRTRVIDVARLPSGPDPPSRMVLLAAFALLGALVATGITVARISFDRMLRDPLDVRRRLGGANFLGAIVRYSGGSRWRGRIRRGSEGEQESGAPHVAWDVAGCIDSVRAALMARSRGSVIGVTSTARGEGASTIAWGLAGSASAAGARVLLVKVRSGDAIYSQCSADPTGRLIDAAGALPGTAGALEDGREDRQCRPGRECALEKIVSHRLQLAALLNACANRYDLIIIDLPPLLLAADLATRCGKAIKYLYVIEWGVISADLAENALAAAGIRNDLIGFVFNKVPRKVITKATFPIAAYVCQRR
jgi:capsular polysaccharide biosynthesis protein